MDAFEGHRPHLHAVATRILGSRAEADDALQEAWIRVERAALALTEAVTRLADRPEPVPDEIWDAAAEHFDETQLGALVLDIGLINLWNRLNVTTQQIVGEHGA